MGFSLTCFVLASAQYSVLCRATLWAGTGNRESFRKLFSRDSIMLWFFKAYWKNKRRYALMMEDAQYAHIKFIRLRSSKDAQRLLDSINPQTVE